MRTSVLLVGAALFLGAPAHAQGQGQPAAQPQAQVPEKMPFDIPFGRPISLEHARKVAATAMVEAKKHNWKMAIAIVEPTGDLVYFEKMDDTQYGSIRVALGKAHSAAIYRRPTALFAKAVNSGSVYVLGLEQAVPVPGGFPLVEKGHLIGAIGVSGGTGAQDSMVAKAGVDSVK
jgi:uncharacterized protein GlcG (DUF336 family)